MNREATRYDDGLFAVATVQATTPPRLRSTLTAMLFSGGRSALDQIGDSHAIRLRQSTEDHTISNLVGRRRLASAGA